MVAAALHAGFQLTVTVVVYPALARTPAAVWPQAHAAHCRRTGAVVALVYGTLLAAWVRVLLAGELPGSWVAAVGSLLTVATTATVAAPTHTRLGREGPRPDLLRRLLRADRVRLLGAGLTLGGALAVAVTR